MLIAVAIALINNKADVQIYWTLNELLLFAVCLILVWLLLLVVAFWEGRRWARCWTCADNWHRFWSLNLKKKRAISFIQDWG
jgi:hypothetical protein